MIYYVTGPLGAGKSYFAVRKIAQNLLKGRAVLTNVDLKPGWEKIILRHTPYYRVASSKKRKGYEREIAERYAFTPDISDLIYGLMHGYGTSRGIRVIDEAHNQVNNREWAEGNQKELLKIMALSRKRGWDDYIIAQHKDNTDAALRRISAVEIRLIDWQQITQIPFFQTKLLPFHLFLAQAFPLNISSSVKSAGKPLWRELFLLGWHRKIYNTFQDFSGTDYGSHGFWDHTPVTLPVPGGFDKATYDAACALDEMMWGYLRAQKKAAAEAAAISEGILESITTRRASRSPLPRPSAGFRTSTENPHPAKSGNEA